MQLHKYTSYSEYVRVQQEGNERKLAKTWARRPVIAVAAHLIRSRHPEVRFGLCHGTRRGQEQQWFMEEFPGAQVLGTEIADTAALFPHTVQMDFHDLRPEWIGQADFVYSNSWDHAFDPARALLNWSRQLSPNGVMLLEHSASHLQSTLLDPFGAKVSELKKLIPRWTRWRYRVAEVVHAERGGDATPSCLLVVTRVKPNRSDAIASRVRPAAVGVEVGVWEGRNAEKVLELCPDLFLYLVDRWCPPPPGDSYHEGSLKIAKMDAPAFAQALARTRKRVERFGPRVEILEQHSLEAAARFGDVSLDFVFLDGDHSFAGVTTDLEAWWPKVKPGGWIGGHDYAHPEQGQVREAVEAFFPGARVELDVNRTWFVKK